MNRRKKNNIIIGALCGVLLLMVVGYAAFNSVLKINGTTSISSNWDIEITNIRGGNPWDGDAYDISEPTYTRDTATFNTGLVTPGDSDRVYEVEITNNGTLDGLVTIGNLSCGNNEAIKCYVYESKNALFDENWSNLNGQSYDFKEGQQDYSKYEITIKPSEKHYIYIDVWYNWDVEKQPENLNANIKLELTYEQAVEGKNITPSINGTAYRFTTDTLYIGDSIKGIETVTDPSALNKNYYLKHEVVDDKITASYVCFVTDTEHCMQGGDNGAAYETNKALIQSQESWFTANGGSCRFGASTSICDGGGFSIVDATSGGYVIASDGSVHCDVYAGGSSSCE